MSADRAGDPRRSGGRALAGSPRRSFADVPSSARRISGALPSRLRDAVRRGRGALARGLALGALCVAASCSRGPGDDARGASLELLEQLAFVPQGRAILPLGAPEISIPEPLFFSMYEVTRGEFERYVVATSRELDPLLAARVAAWRTGDAALPAVFVNRAEAADYASWLGLRLPTAREWLFAALSPRALAYPWSDVWQQGRANTLDLMLEPRRPTPVGTFEGGRTSTHLYDMLGNVWEWCADDLAGGVAPEFGASALGGSFLRWKQETFRNDTFFAQSLHPASRFDDLGFRACVSAREWLAAHAPELGEAPDARRRLAAIGRRWGASSTPLLAELAEAARDRAAREALDALLEGARR